MRGFPDRTHKRTDGIDAATLVAQVGAKRLIGKTVMTPPLGDYPGGPGVVIEVGHDPGAPEIVFRVRNDEWKRSGNSDDGEMGIFDYEIVKIIGPDRNIHPDAKRKSVNEERLRAGHHDLRVFSGEADVWEVWLEPVGGELDGVCLGGGATRDEAVQCAVDALESALAKLQETPSPEATAKLTTEVTEKTGA